MFNLFKDIAPLCTILTKRDKWKFIALFGLMVVGAFLEAIGIGVIPIFVSFIMNPSSLATYPLIGEWFFELPNEPSLRFVFFASALLLGLFVLKNLFLGLVIYVQARIVTTQRLNLGDRLFKAYQLAPYEWHLQRSSSELLRNIQDDTANVVNRVITPLLTFIMALVVTTFVILVLILSTPMLGLASLMITGVGLFLVIKYSHRLLLNIGVVNREEVQAMFKAIHQGFGALVDARILNVENYLRQSHRKSLSRIAKAQREQMTIQGSTPLVVETVVVCGLLVILLLLLSGTDDLASVVPTIALLGVATMRLKQLASQIANSINRMNTGRAYVPNIVKDLHELETVELYDMDNCTNSAPGSEFKSLILSEVRFTYSGCRRVAIDGISLEFIKGESIAFIGETGCGKSTLVNLILGLLSPSAGEISVNGANIQDDIRQWWGHIGYIPQSIYLIDDTIRENIAFGIPVTDIDEEKVLEALRSARISEFVNTLPDGLDTIVGERGVRLSGGQRQRLGIARALYADPDILVMDEATSALDNKTEVEVMQAIRGLKINRTLIMVAHRLSTVEECDRLYFMQNGRIVATGTFDELKKSSVAFSDMLARNVT